jgi:hypothetical protein
MKGWYVLVCGECSLLNQRGALNSKKKRKMERKARGKNHKIIVYLCRRDNTLLHAVLSC